MRRAVFVLLVCLAALGAPAGDARAGQCGLPDAAPLWIDFADGSVSFRNTVFRRPGLILATSGSLVPQALRDGGGQTIFWEMRLRDLVGTPAAPADPATIEAAASALVDEAASSSGCTTPLIALNELNGSNATPPWSPTTAQHRANVLALLQGIAARGARAFLLVPGRPYTGGEAAAWWQAVAQVADIVPEVYFAAPLVASQGALVGSRALRVGLRQAIANFAGLGIPSARIGVMLGFQSGVGTGGREGLQPAATWLEVVKLEALAGRQVASELGLGSVWSWGWGTFGPASADPDKPLAACVYLWTRDPGLCDGPAAAGTELNGSLIEGQIALAAGAECSLASGEIKTAAVDRLAVLTGDRRVALTALLERLVVRAQATVERKDVLLAERAVVEYAFAGSRDAFLSELAEHGVTLDLARGVLADELRRRNIAANLPVEPPQSDEIRAYYRAQAGRLSRAVEVTPAPSWLGGAERGTALAALAPGRIFRLPAGRTETLRTREGSLTVRAFGRTVPLRRRRLAAVQQEIAAALVETRRRAALESWREEAQTTALESAICLRDELPSTGTADLAGHLPFLRLT